MPVNVLVILEPVNTLPTGLEHIRGGAYAKAKTLLCQKKAA